MTDLAGTGVAATDPFIEVRRWSTIAPRPAVGTAYGSLEPPYRRRKQRRSFSGMEPGLLPYTICAFSGERVRRHGVVWCVVTKNKALKGLLVLAACSVPLVSQTVPAADAGPTVSKDSLLLNAYTLNVYKKDYDKWSWVPCLAFRVNGPIPSGGQLYAEFTIPGAAMARQFHGV
jgi:hypothetical protein